MATTNSESRTVFLCVVIGGIILMIFLRALGMLAYLGYNCFFFLDNLFCIKPFNPVVVWGIIGLFIGSVFGVIVAVKKYNLAKTLVLYPIGFVILLFLLMGLINKPANYSIRGKITIPSSVAPPSYTIIKYFYTVTAAQVNIRSGPSKNTGVVLKVTRGTLVEAIDTTSVPGWYKVSCNGLEGYISSKFVSFSHSQNFSAQ